MRLPILRFDLNIALLLLTVAGSTLAPIASRASSYNLPPFSDFVAEAKYIVRGKLNSTRVDAMISSNGLRSIYTYGDLEVKEVLKGAINKPSITIRKPGGTKDGFTLEIPGSPEFVIGQDTVYFLTEEKDDQSYEVNSLELGKFEVIQPDDPILSGGLFALSRSEGHELDPEQTKKIAENLKVWKLTDLRSLIQKQAPCGLTSASSVTSVSPTPPVQMQASPTNNPEVAVPHAIDPPVKDDEPSHAGRWILLLASLFFVIFLFRKRR